MTHKGAHNPKRDCFLPALHRRELGGVSVSTVKRLCLKCETLISPEGFAYISSGYRCMCLMCDAMVADAHNPQGAGENFERRMNPNA